MKKYLLIILLYAVSGSLSAQNRFIDSLIYEAGRTTNDTMRYEQLSYLSIAYSELRPDSSLFYAQKALEIAQDLKLKLNEAISLGKMGYAQQNMGNYPRSLQLYLSALAIAEDPSSERNILPGKFLKVEDMRRTTTGLTLRLSTLGYLHEFIAILYENANVYDKELLHLKQSIRFAEQLGDSIHLSEIYYVMGRTYLALKQTDSAFFYEESAIKLETQLHHQAEPGELLTLGKCYLAIGKNQEAIEYLRKSLAESETARYLRGVIASSLLLSDISRQQNKMDSSLYFANSALKLAEQMNSPDLLLRTYSELVAFYNASNHPDSTAKYQALIIQLKDSLFNSKQAQAFQNVDFDEQQRQQEVESVKKSYRDRFQKYGLLSGLMILLLTAIILWRNNRNRKKAYSLLKMQKQETEFQKSKVEQTLEKLKSTQSQLIQSEKMASLGELTAGIAHEIQNPMNFVNNFSEVNKELAEELKSELAIGNTQLANEIADDIKENSEKINHHGKRADAIVKGMLQHSRTSFGKKELTDINALCDEYVRLAYHGLRAKDKSFSAKFETDFDNSIGKIRIVPQDIGRVVLNLINNAFYAVSEKKILRQAQGDSYEPTVTVNTKKVNDEVEIRVADNGNGISELIKEKIFQPFFTTKPAGKGTGLGLSLSYDIIRAHGGNLNVKSKEGEGAEFLIVLPFEQAVS
jgi:two-component system, NtrC family, sensor kinase